MDYISIQKAALMVSDQDRNVHYTTLLYAAHLGDLPCRWTGSTPLVAREKWEKMINEGIRIPKLTEMIRKDLKDEDRITEKEYALWLEEDEEPMTEEDFEEYERLRIVRMATRSVKRMKHGNREKSRQQSIF